MIANQIPAFGPENEDGNRLDLAEIPALPAEVPTEQECEIALAELVMRIREDVANDPIFYLVRSNTSCDGE